MAYNKNYKNDRGGYSKDSRSRNNERNSGRPSKLDKPSRKLGFADLLYNDASVLCHTADKTDASACFAVHIYRIKLFFGFKGFDNGISSDNIALVPAFVIFIFGYAVELLFGFAVTSFTAWFI